MKTNKAPSAQHNETKRVEGTETETETERRVREKKWME